MNPNQQYSQPQTQQGPATGSSPGTLPKQKVSIKGNPNSTQNMLQIAEIRDGLVIMDDGSFRSVIMVKAINFDLMSEQEREAVEFAYQGFLNSLYFPIQIFIHSERVDITPYLERLEKIRQQQDNMLLSSLMDDYITYVGAISQDVNIMDKRFYIIVPYYPVIDMQKAITQSKNFFTGVKKLFSSTKDRVVINEASLGKAKDELRNRVQATLNGLQQAGVQGLPLDTQELIELYYDTYNPDTATRQKLRDFGDVSTPYVTKGEGRAPQPNLTPGA